MDPGGSELESSLSQLDNPCLIVEDSQPDSAALEEDPDSSYRSLLARRLSNLQPTSPSPVLELISSPAGSRCSQTGSLVNVQTNTQANSAPLELSQSSKAQAHSQALELCPPSNQNSALTPVNGKCAGREMDAGADSTTQCVQSEESMSQVGFLELSESQGLGLEQDRKEESQAERARTPPKQTDSQRQANQGALQKPTTGLASGSQDGTSKRAEVSSSCSSEHSSGDRKEMSIQHLLHGQDSEAATEPRTQEEEDDDDEVPSSQDDMFDAAKTGGGVDSTVTEPEGQRRPTCTPASTLHLLHLSGHDILVQESLSQNSVDFVAPTQDGLSQTPLIVPNSPTAQEDQQASDEPMDTSLPPDEPDCSHKRAEEPMEMDQAPVQSRAVPKPRPSASTPVSQHSPGFAPEKSLSVPVLPELSHDIFVPTQSQETISGSDKAKMLMKKADKERPFTQPGSHSGVKHVPSQSEPNEVNESFQLELSTHSEQSSFAQPPQEPAEGEDSQDTQIEELERAVETVTSRHSSQEEGNRTQPEPQPKNTLGVSQVPEVRKTGTLLEGIKVATENLSRGSRCEPKPATRAANVMGATETIDLTCSGSSQKQGTVHVPHAASFQQKAMTIDLTTRSSQEKDLPFSASSACVPHSLSSLTQSQSVLPKTSDADSPAQDVMDIQSRSAEACVNSRTSIVQSSQDPSQTRGNATVSVRNDPDKADEEEVYMDEAEKPDESTGAHRSGLSLGLSLSQSQALSPEPMEEECSPLSQGKGILKEHEQNSMGKEQSSSLVLVEESEIVSQQKGRLVTSQTERVVTSQTGRGVPPGSQGASQSSRREGTLGGVSHRRGSNPGPAAKVGPQSIKPADACSPRGAGGRGAENSGSQNLSDSSGEVPFHFTLPKEGQLIGPEANATPPLISQLKQTPRHSTPIGMTSFSERSAGDVTRETDMAASDIAAEESGEATKGDLTTSAAAESDGKLSLRMKLVTPVEEGSSGSERFSLQKPALSEEEGSVSKVTAVVKAVTSSRPSSSVFSRVCEARRQVEAEEKVLPSVPCIPTRADLFSSPLSQESEAPRSQGQWSKNVTVNSQSGEPSGSPQGEGSVPASVAGSSVRERVQRHGAREEQLHTETLGARLSTPQGEEAEEGETTSTPPRQRAGSQQASFDRATIPSPPSKLRQRAVSQQTSFEASGPQCPVSRGEPATPSPRAPPGQLVRRHMRTVREVRTTVTRVITDVYYENGQEVDRKVTEEAEEPVVDSRVVENDVSPSRTGSSMTSGDLADVSSLSSKASSLQHSSSGASSGGQGPGRRADFIAPSARGAKSASPRKGSGQQQRAHRGRGGSNGTEHREGTQGTPPLTPVSPRGRARRGRPPSRSPLSRGAGVLSREAVRGPPFSSEEDEPYMQVYAHKADTPRKQSSPETSGGASSFVGLRVVAKWSSNGYFYSGCITQDMGAGRFRLLFDDSYECDVPGRDILLCDPIPLETEVTALSEDEYFSTGVVKGHKTEGSELLYGVEKDGQRKWYGRMAVILSMDQGNRLREQFGLGPYEPATPLAKASDISLDNLVEGKRKRRGGAETPSRGSSSSHSPRTPGASGKRKLISSAEEEKTPAKRGRKSAGSRSGQRLDVCNTSGSGADLPSDPDELVETHGPLPPSASLFLGYAFLLTASSERDRETNLLADEEEERVQTAPYNKSYTENQLEAGGGFILQDFNERQCKAAYQSLLIADQHCRTRKYLLCVASGIPCVSHVWVRDCCHDNQLLNYRNYLLPAGVGLEGRVVEWHSHRSPFQALKVLLVFAESTEFWADLLRMGGAASVCHRKVESNSPDALDDALDLVVTDRSCPPSVLRRAASLDLPVLSPEWVVQSLVSGERQGYSSHAQFRHDYSP